MKIWICIPVYNRIGFTVEFLHSLRAQSYRNFEAVICDHGSTDGTGEILARDFPEVVVIKAESSLWWTGAINRCLAFVLPRAAAADAVLVINNDNVAQPDYLQNLAAAHLALGRNIISSTVYDIKTGRLTEPGYRQNWYLASAKAVDWSQAPDVGYPGAAEVSHASGRGVLYPVRAFRELGLFDELHLPHYAADYDFSFLAARAGYRIYACLDCKVYSHVEETGMVKVLSALSWRSFVDYFCSMRSPAKLSVRFWYGWRNCPRWYFPVYLVLDLGRVFGAYFKSFLIKRK